MNTMNDMSGKTDEEILESLNRTMSKGVTKPHIIRGFTHYTPFYNHIAETAPHGVKFVEVGVWEGAGLIYLKQKRPDLKVIGVDWGLGQNELGKGFTADKLLDNLQHTRLVSEIPIILWDSSKAATFFDSESCWGVFLDADHSEEALTRDIKAWWPKVEVGGWLAGDDYNNTGDGWPGVKLAVDKEFPGCYRPDENDPFMPAWTHPYTWAVRKW